MANRIGSERFFERGIESVAGTPLFVDLPDAYSLSPSDFAQPAALDAILRADNLESMLERAVRPDVADPDLLTPQRFRAAMESVMAYFAAEAGNQERINPLASSKYGMAAKVLRDEDELRELLRMYRSALLQG